MSCIKSSIWGCIRTAVVREPYFFQTIRRLEKKYASLLGLDIGYITQYE